MNKVNEFFEATRVSLNGYRLLADAMVSNQTLDSVMVEGVELNDIEDGDIEFSVRCFDGVGLAVSDDKNVILAYPRLENLSADERVQCLEYRGITDDEINYGDVMMLFGKAIMIHHKIV
jgi:hypothetical protein